MSTKIWTKEEIKDKLVTDNRWLARAVCAIYNYQTTDEAEWYIEDDNFKDLMGTFLFLMKNACKSGGLYCDGIVDSYSK